MGYLRSLVLIAISAWMLNSCVYVSTHRACADRGRQCQAVVIPDQENLVIYQHNGKLYLQGVLTTVRRTGRDKITNFTMNEFGSGQFVPIRGSLQRYVYREIGAADIIENDYFSVLNNRKIPKGAKVLGSSGNPSGYQITSLNCNPITTRLQYGWKTELPRYARRVNLRMVTSEHQQVGSHVCNTRHGFIIPVTPSRTNKHAWYAYPLAGVSFICIDLPGTIVANTVVPIVYGVAAIPCSIYEQGRRILVTPDK